MKNLKILNTNNDLKSKSIFDLKCPNFKYKLTIEGLPCQNTVIK